MTTTVAISAMRMDFKHRLKIDRRWPDYNGWERVKETEKYVKAAPQSPPTPLVTAVKGEKTALSNAEVEYCVTDYNINVSQNDKDRVKWIIKVGTEEGVGTLQSTRGEKLKIKIKEEWVGKEITVMPYLKKPNPDVSVKTLEGERLSLFFNGKFLTFRVVEEAQILRFSYKAVSGRALEDGSFDYSRNRQKTKNEGPLPEGEYYINPQEIQYTNDRSVKDKFYGVIGRGTMRGGEYAWGVGRIWILPQTVTIDGIDRNDFSIHGGHEAGSAGCIDLTDNDKTFFKKIEEYRMREVKIKLIIKY